MGQFIDMTGWVMKDHGVPRSRIIVIKRAEDTIISGKKVVNWLCTCSCDKNKDPFIVPGGALRSGNTLSCGCLQSETAKEVCANRDYSTQSKKHGQYKSKIYSSWQHMKDRCYNPNFKQYKDYGGRGITICDEWKYNFESFYNWAIANGWKENLTIDRIDTDKGYYPENCKWSTKVEQSNNTRRNRFIEIDGENHTIAEWCRIKSISVKMVDSRLRRGWSPQDAILIPKGATRKYARKN